MHKKLLIVLIIAALALASAQSKPDDKQTQAAKDKDKKPADDKGKPSMPTGQLREGEKGHGQVPIWQLKEDQLKFRPSEQIRGSVMTATKLVMDACLAREPATAGVHFSPLTVITYKSVLPAGGVYKGWIGLLDLGMRSKLTFHLERFSYTIPFVDEARGVSVVRMKYAGKFVRTGAALESGSTIYLKWQFGKIRKAYIIDDDPEAVANAFHTAAEKTVSNFYNSLFECGDCASKYIADNFKSTVHMYPKNAAEKLSYSGIEEFKKHVNSVTGNLLLNQIQSIRFLYGSDDTVVVLTKLAPGSAATRISGLVSGQKMMGSEMGSVSDTSSLRDLASVSICKVKGDKLESCNIQLNQPILPWHMRQLGLYAATKKGTEEAKLPAKKGTTESGGSKGDDKKKTFNAEIKP